MNENEFYKDTLQRLETAKGQVLDSVDVFIDERIKVTGENPVEYRKARIKKVDSMLEKLERKGYPKTLESALTKVTDAVGVRIVCDFMDDVYATADFLANQEQYEVIKVKDYIKNPKENGYRSFHIILKIHGGKADNIYVEVQIRTMALDCWASLEHQMKYKHSVKHQKLISDELKRCADEIASTDLSMQTIRELINSGE